jgi:methylase of polypeptide subunit release factors
MEVSKEDIDFLIRDKYDGSTENRAAVARDIRRLSIGEPLAYVIGWVPFMGLTIFLDSKPLIPRPETEWWVELLITALRESPRFSCLDSVTQARLSARDGNQPEGMGGAMKKVWPDPDGRTEDFLKSASHPRILDLCAGSGAIGCALMKAFPAASVSFGELIPEHEATIRKNIEENGLDATRADIRIGDLFAPFRDEKFDVITANPPYIPAKRPLDESVSRFEPKEALYAGEDGLALVKRIAEEAPAHMNEGGVLWLECDTEHAETARELVAAHAKRAELRNDHYGRPRLIIGYY